MNDQQLIIFKQEHLTDTPPEGSELKVGTKVKWTNDYGVEWEHKVIGFNYEREYNKNYNCFVHLNTESYWFPHDHKALTVIKN